MSLTLPQPSRTVALVGALVLTALAVVVLLVGRGKLAGEPTPTGATRTPVTHATPAPSAGEPAARPTRVTSGFPPRIDHALRYSRVVVVSVSMPGAAVDAVVRREARIAAKTTRAAFVPLSALNEGAVTGLVAKAGVLPDPAVVIIKRPGSVVATYSVTDAGTIAQAVAQARR